MRFFSQRIDGTGGLGSMLSCSTMSPVGHACEHAERQPTEAGLHLETGRRRQSCVIPAAAIVTAVVGLGGGPGRRSRLEQLLHLLARLLDEAVLPEAGLIGRGSHRRVALGVGASPGRCPCRA